MVTKFYDRPTCKSNWKKNKVQNVFKSLDYGYGFQIKKACTIVLHLKVFFWIMNIRKLTSVSSDNAVFGIFLRTPELTHAVNASASQYWQSLYYDCLCRQFAFTQFYCIFELEVKEKKMELESKRFSWKTYTFAKVLFQ